MVAIGDVPPVLGRTGRGTPLALGLQGEAETEATSAAANSNVLENMVTLGVWMDVWGVMLFYVDGNINSATALVLGRCCCKGIKLCQLKSI